MISKRKLMILTFRIAIILSCCWISNLLGAVSVAQAAGFEPQVEERALLMDDAAIDAAVQATVAAILGQNPDMVLADTETGALPLRERIAGTYSVFLDEGMMVQAEVKVLGNIVFLESVLKTSDGNLDSWLTELIPANPSVLESLTENEIAGQAQEFSAYNMDGYSTESFPLSLLLQGDEFEWIDNEEWSVNYQRSVLLGSLHQDALSMAEQVRNHVPASAQVSFDGDWMQRDGDRDSWLQLRNDGSFFFVSKRDRLPIRVFQGGYVYDRDHFELRILAEQAGIVSDSAEYVLTASQTADGALVLAGDAVSIFIGDWDLTPRMILRPVTDQAWRFRADKTEEPGAVAYIADNLFGEMTALDGEIYVQDWGSMVTYSYHVPELYIDHPEAEAINREIRQNYADFAHQQINLLENNLADQVESFEMNYQMHVFGDLLTMILVRWDRWSLTQYEVILYDLSTNRRVSKNELLTTWLGLSEQKFLDDARAAAENHFIASNAQIPLADRALYGYDDALALTVSDQTINMENLQPFLDTDGRLAAAMPIASMAGPVYVNEIVYLYED